MLVSSGPTFEMALAEYFRAQLNEHAERLKPRPQDDTLWYLGNLLARFGSSDQVFAWENGELTLRPLALLYRDAHEASAERERCLILRQLGDLSLFIGSLFPENYARRGIRKDYFIGMGGGAYDYLSEKAVHNRHIFSELASMFTRLLDLIAHACSRENVVNAADILEIYERWRHTKDPFAEQQLRSLGIVLDSPTSLQ